MFGIFIWLFIIFILVILVVLASLTAIFPKVALINLDVQKSLVGILTHVTDIMSKNNIVYWLEGGTLLGSIRENRIMIWDDDTDIGIDAIDIEKVLALDFGYFQNSKIEFVDKSWGVQLSNGHIWTDIFLYDHVGDTYTSRYCKYIKHVDVFKSSDLFPLKVSPLFDKEFPVANNPIPYLKSVYGDKWQTEAKIKPPHSGSDFVSVFKYIFFSPFI